MSNLTNTKSLLAKLLASENLTVEHGNYSTASMDVKNRVLRLPIWKEMSGSLYDLMVLHEVGHALYTPEDGWHGAGSNKGRGYKSFLNVVEDARIERKIKDKYPGGRRSFTQGYLELIKKDFFGLRGVDVEELNLIDKINLHFKGGTVHDITFSDEESEFIEKVKGTRTWEDVVRVTDELYEYAKDHESETDMSDHDFTTFEMSDDDSDDEEEMDDSMDDFSEEETDGFEEMKKFIEGLEAGEEEKEEDSGSSAGTGEGEGESEEKGKETGESDKAGEDEEGEKAKSGNSKSDDVSNEPSDKSGFGSGAGVGTPDFDNKEKSHEPRSITDDNFRAREDELVEDDDKKSSIEYANLPEANLKNIIIDHKEIHSLIRDHYVKTDASHDEEENQQIDKATKAFVEFRNRNKKTVEYLAKEFEMKKAAAAHSRTATANSGIIDTSILHTYKYNEHIFKKINVTLDGKNHGLVMVVDWSGSMGNNIKGTLEQMMVLVMFAQRVNIPFEVFLFSDSYPSEIRKNARDCERASWTHSDNGKNGDLMIDAHHLLNVFSSRMRANELHEAYVNMTAIARCYDVDRYSRYYRYYRTMPDGMSLGGTPLNGSLLAINTFIPEFKAKSNVQIVNLIYLTDGDSSGGRSVWDRTVETREDGSGGTYEHQNEFHNLSTGYSYSSKKKTIIRDMETKREYQVGQSSAPHFSRGSMTNTLVKVLRDKHGVNVVNFFLIPKFTRYDALEFADDKIPHEQVLSGWRKNGYVIGSNYGGWSEIYILKGGHHLVTDEAVLEVKEDAKKGDIKRAFSKFNKNKLQNRVVLSKFVDMVAV